MVNCSSTVVLAVATAGLFVARTEGFSRSPPASSSSSSVLFLAEGRGDYYGESGSSFVIREFGAYDQLEGIVELTGRPLPERPDGIVCVAKYSSSLDPACVKTEAQYERLARDNPSTCFLRCFREYEDGDLLIKLGSLPFPLLTCSMEGIESPGFPVVAVTLSWKNFWACMRCRTQSWTSSRRVPITAEDWNGAMARSSLPWTHLAQPGDSSLGMIGTRTMVPLMMLRANTRMTLRTRLAIGSQTLIINK